MSPILLLLSAALAEPIPESSPKHAYHFQAPILKVGEVALTAPTAWARMNELKVKVHFDNPSDRYVLVPRDGFTAQNSAGTFGTASGAGRYEIVFPFGTGNHTFTVLDPEGRLHERQFTAQLHGYATASRVGEPVPVEPITLPVAENRFTAGPFTCSAEGKLKRKPDDLVATWSCRFEGQAGTMGLVDPAALAVVVPAGRFANEWRGGVQVVLPGDTAYFKLRNTVLQPAAHGVDLLRDPIPVAWEGVLSVTTLEPAFVDPWAFTLDEALTRSKND